MTTNTLTLSAIFLVAFAPAGSAQPARPNDPTRTVTLAIGEYNRLIDLASRPPQGPSLPPVAAVLGSAEVRGRVERDTVRGTIDAIGDVLRSGFSRVKLLSGATLVNATAAGQPLPLVADGDTHTAVLPGPGPFALNLEWAAPLRFTPGRASFVLPVPPAGTARATFDVPTEQADVRLSAGLITARSTAGGRTTIEATLDPGSSTEVSWSMRDSAPMAAAREVRTLADVMTLVTLGDSDVRMVTLVDVTVVQGEPRTMFVRLPAGYELTGISGSSLETSEQRDGGVVLTLADPAARRHQILISLERQHAGGSFAFETAVPTMESASRERGEIAVEGVGTLDLKAQERDGMQRIDVRELTPELQSLSRVPVLSAFRYQRRADSIPGLSLDVQRFADAGVLAAVAESAFATTLVTAEGRALTEIVLRLQNRAQPFLKVVLPSGASIVSVEVEGQSAKPVRGDDGTRVPLLRPGFRPKGPYTVAFVYLHEGVPFARKGDMRMMLPRMDVPVAFVEWELFMPGAYSVRTTGGNVIDRRSLANSGSYGFTMSELDFEGTGVPIDALYGTAGGAVIAPIKDGAQNVVRGRVVDSSGMVMPGVEVVLESPPGRRSTTTTSDGSFVFSDVKPGAVTLTAKLLGFSPQTLSFVAGEESQQVNFGMRVDSITETITVSAAAPRVENSSAQIQAPLNVVELQRRTAGVLPVRIDVPRAGTSIRFVKPLVVNQETTVTLRYKRR